MTAAWVAGLPKPVKGTVDQFVGVPIGRRVPVGYCKLYVIKGAACIIASNGLLCLMPGAATFAKVYGDLATIEAKGVAFHTGAYYCLENTDIELVKIDQNKESCNFYVSVAP